METIQSLVEKLGGADPAQDFRAYYGLWQIVAAAGTPGNDAERSKVAQELAAELNAEKETTDGEGKKHKSVKYSPAVRGRIAQLLACVAAESEVESLQKSLGDFETREMARWALDRTPCAPATAALSAAACDGVGPEFRVGAINALGRRGGAEAVAALTKASADPDAEVRLAAIEGLALIGDAAADNAVAAVMADRAADPRAWRRALKARLRLAETLAAAGDKDGAKKVFQAVLACDADEPQSAAARLGLSKLG
ncbi:MAG: HEAT repeat domain-containing protein [Pirellulales bacterium]|nr:HEAT repeat domain-containing protein [Pirellulales bacterium]